MNDSTSVLTYTLQREDDTGFSTRYVDDEKLPQDASIIFIVPHFSIFITGDLSFYVDVLGMPNSCSYWCPWCLLSRVEWQESVNNTGDQRTDTFLIDTYEKIKNDTKKRLQATEKKGVSSAMHYKSLAPSNFVPPLLHMEIGMVNQAWENFVNWVDDVVEKIPEDENIARTAVVDATDNLKE